MIDCESPARAARQGRVNALMLVIMAAFALLQAATPGFAAKTTTAASNSRASREDATRSIPFNKLDSEWGPKIKRVVGSPSIFRRLPIQVLDCDPNLYLFMLNNPDVIVNIWQVMGITKVELARTSANTFEANDGAGAKGTIQIVYSDHGTQIMYIDGVYDGPMFPKPLQAQCVLVLKAAYMQETNGRYYVTSRCDAFIHMDNVGLDLLAKTFQPIVNKSADINFAETAGFISNVSRTSETKPAGVANLGRRLTHISPDTRDRFIAITQDVARRAAENRAVATKSPNTASVSQMRAQNDGRR